MIWDHEAVGSRPATWTIKIFYKEIRVCETFGSILEKLLEMLTLVIAVRLLLVASTSLIGEAILLKTLTPQIDLLNGGLKKSDWLKLKKNTS